MQYNPSVVFYVSCFWDFLYIYTFEKVFFFAYFTFITGFPVLFLSDLNWNRASMIWIKSLRQWFELKAYVNDLNWKRASMIWIECARQWFELKARVNDLNWQRVSMIWIDSARQWFELKMAKLHILRSYS